MVANFVQGALCAAVQLLVKLYVDETVQLLNIYQNQNLLNFKLTRDSRGSLKCISTANTELEVCIYSSWKENT